MATIPLRLPRQSGIGAGSSIGDGQTHWLAPGRSVAFPGTPRLFRPRPQTRSQRDRGFGPVSKCLPAAGMSSVEEMTAADKAGVNADRANTAEQVPRPDWPFQLAKTEAKRRQIRRQPSVRGLLDALIGRSSRSPSLE